MENFREEQKKQKNLNERIHRWLKLEKMGDEQRSNHFENCRTNAKRNLKERREAKVQLKRWKQCLHKGDKSATAQNKPSAPA